MRIIQLEAENVKRLTAVNIKPDGNMVEITGRNGAGKTSVLDSIWWALAGTRSHQSQPIRQGATEARIRLDLGEVVVTREFKAGKDGAGVTTRIKVETADGARFPSPQKMLDDLVGGLSFDPLEFSRMPPPLQYDSLRRMLGLDFSEAEAANREDYRRRRDLNAVAKAARARAEGIALGEPVERVDTRAIDAELQSAIKANNDWMLRKASYEEATRTVTRLRSEMEDANAKAARLGLELEAAESERNKIESFSAVPPCNENTLRLQWDDAVRNNVEADRYEQRRETRKAAIAEAHVAEESAAALTEVMNERKADMAAQVAAADMPIEGLGLGDGVVTLYDLPLNQASDAEQLRVSCAIAMRSSGKLRVIRVRDGSLLDKYSLEVLRSMAEATDSQVWIERVDTSGKIGFVIEDGALKAPDVG